MITGPVPTLLQKVTRSQGFKGANTLKPYNDEQTVVFHDSFSRIKVRYEELPNDAQELRVTETPHVRPYDLNRDYICKFTDNTYSLRGFGSSLVGWWRMLGTQGENSIDNHRLKRYRAKHNTKRLSYSFSYIC